MPANLPLQPMRWLFGLLAAVLLTAGLTVGAVYVFDLGKEDAGDVADGPDPTTVEIVLPEGQTRVTGVMTSLSATGAQVDPLAVPITVTTPDRGDGAGATFEGALVDGEANAIVWDAGRPLELGGVGALQLGPIAVLADAGGVVLGLDGPAHGLTPGVYDIATPVAVGSEGLGTPVNSVSFEATADTSVVFSGGAIVTLPVQPFVLRGPGSVTLTGTLRVETNDGVTDVTSITLAARPVRGDDHARPRGSGQLYGYRDAPGEHRSLVNTGHVRLLAVLIALVLGAGIAAAFTKGESDQSVAALASAAQRLEQSGSARMELTFEAEANGHTATVTGAGLFDFANAAQSLTLALPDGSSIELTGTGATVYVRTPTTGGWVQIDLTGDLADEALQAAGGQDPLAVLDQLRTVADIESKGTENLRGIEVTHYSGELDFEKAIEQSGLPPDQIDEFNAAVEEGDLVVDSTVDAFVDADGLVHRVHTNVDVEDVVTMRVTVDLLDIGVPVTITLPAAEEVVRVEQAGTREELYTLMQSLAG